MIDGLRALLIRHPWIDLILAGKKTWEIRGARTSVRGRIGLVASRSGTVIGVCDLVDCIGPLTAEQYRKNAKKAGMRPSEARLGYYRLTYAWVLEKPRRLKHPVPYQHPSGAVIWVKLDAAVERKVKAQLRSMHRDTIPGR
jgi:ASCH domain